MDISNLADGSRYQEDGEDEGEERVSHLEEEDEGGVEDDQPTALPRTSLTPSCHSN